MRKYVIYSFIFLLSLGATVGLYYKFLDVNNKNMGTQNNKNFDEQFQEYKSQLENQKNINSKNTQKIILAGGCFWCIEGAFDEFPGVASAVSGYIGGDKKTANYQDVSTGETKHREAVEVSYDPEITPLETILDRFFSYIDPYDFEGQFADKGYQYTTAIYYSDDNELQKIDSYIENKDFEKPLATKVLPVSTFYEAEEYHQDYARKSSFRYQLYFKGSGRKDYVEKNK